MSLLLCGTLKSRMVAYERKKKKARLLVNQTQKMLVTCEIKARQAMRFTCKLGKKKPIACNLERK